MRRTPRIAIRTMIFASVLAACAAPGASAQDEPSANLAERVLIRTQVSPESLTIGDAVRVEVEVQAPADFDVSFPNALNEEGGKIVLTQAQAQEPEADSLALADGLPLLWKAQYDLRVLDVGHLVLPPWPVQLTQAGRSQTAFTDSIRFEVESVLTDSLADVGLQGLKQQADLEVPLPTWVWYGLAALGLVALLTYLWWRRRRKHTQPVIVPPPRPAHELALEALRRLEGLRLPDEGRIKEHYIELSEILRRYLEDAPGFRVPALEQTSEEILHEMKQRDFPDGLVASVSELCAESDLVKFAKHSPSIEDCMQALVRLRKFVLETSRTPVVPRVGLESVGGDAA